MMASKENEYISPQQLAEILPLEEGDTVLIASNVERLVWNAVHNDQSFDFNLLIDLLQKRIGNEGNILFPAYNWDFCKGVVWDYHKTKSQTGTLSRIALKRADFVRTRHAIYSFAVWGKEARTLYEMNDRNSFIGNTPFAFLDSQENSKMVTLDVNLTDCFTYVHYIEELNGVPYRFRKNFIGQYIDENGKEETRTYSMYVRYLDRPVITDFTGLENELLQDEKMKLIKFGDIVIRVLPFRDVHEIVERDIKNNNFNNIVRLE